MKRVNLELPDELLARVDEAAGDVPRNRWLRRAIEQALAFQQDASDALDSLPPEATVRDAAEALKPPIARYLSQPGPNVENVRSSAQAKRNVKPMPKRGKK